MLPETVARSASATTTASDKNHTVLFSKDHDDDKPHPPRPQRVPSTDFSTHFVVKGSSSNTSELGNAAAPHKKVLSIPSITISRCPDEPSRLPCSSRTNNNSLFLPFLNEPVQVEIGRPMTAPPLPYQEPSLDASSFPAIEVDSGSRPSSSSGPNTARRSSSLQHPFMRSPQKPFPGTMSSSGRMFDTSSPRTTLLTFPDSPMDFSYQPVSPFCLRKNRMGEYEKDDEKANCGIGAGEREDGDYETILKVCGQRSPIPVDMIFNGVKDIEKIGEGVYGEVYSGSFRYFNQCSWVYKVVAIAGDAMVNGEKQKGFMEVLPEIVVSQELSKLKGVLNKCYTDGYAYMKNARIAKGRYPGNLIQPWEKFNEKYESDNDKPEFGPEQLYMVLEFEFAGQDIESLNFRDARQTLSIVLQVAHILAVGEVALEFEHRDLHWGNILVQTWQAPTIRYLINGETYLVPSIGIKAAVIDFTISRVKHSKTQAITYLDLQDDEEQFLGTGDHQFDIYRMMRDHNRNNWQVFSPKSNIFWLHYLSNKLYVKGQYTAASTSSSGSTLSSTVTNRKSAHHLRAVRKLREISHSILEHESAQHFIQSKECQAYREFLGLPISTPGESAPPQK